MALKKIVCLGGGSLYFKRALPDLLISEELAGSEIVLYDIDADKIKRMAQTISTLLSQTGDHFSVRWTTNMADAVDGANFALASIGGAGVDISSNVYSSRYRNNDVRIAEKYGVNTVIGDTCGPAAMMMAFRSIPAYIEICREMEKRCPGVIMLNHSNPMAVICKALHKYTSIKTIGICHGVQWGIRNIAKILQVQPVELELEWIGTNHYYWFTKISKCGKNLYPQVLKYISEQPPVKEHALSTKLAQIYGHLIVYALDSHIIEFYPYLAQTSKLCDLPANLIEEMKRRGYDPSIPAPNGNPPSESMRKKFFEQYESLLSDAKMPEKRESYISGEGLGSFLSAIVTGRREICIVNIENKGAIGNLPYDAEVELEVVTDGSGVRRLGMGEAPLVLKGILHKRFAWQELVADAAVKGDRNLALQALLLDEVAIAPNKAELMLDELLEGSRNLLGQFFKSTSKIVYTAPSIREAKERSIYQLHSSR